MNKIISVLIVLLGHSFASFADEIPLKIAVVQEFGQFNPITINLASTESFLHFVLRGITVQDDKGTVIADLAEKVPTLKNKKAIWTIKEKAKWSDGKPLTCQDWWLGWQVGLSPNTGTQFPII